MPKLIRLYLHSVALGFALSGAFTAALLWLDVAGIGHLVGASDIGAVAVAMLVVFNGIVFSAVQFAYRVMGMAETEPSPPGGRRLREPVPVPVRADFGPAAPRLRAKRRH